MEFEQWVAAQGFDLNELTEQQTTNLRTLSAQAASTQTETDASDETDDDSVEAGQPASTTVSTTGTPLPLDPIDTMRRRWSTERKRIAAIAGLFANRHPELEARAVEEGWDQNRSELELLRAERAEVVPVSNSEGGAGRATCLEAALCLSAGLPEERVGGWYDEPTMNQAVSREMRGAGLHTLLYEVIRASGGHVRPGRIDNDVIRAAFVADDRQIQASSGFSTLTLAGILSNVANKTMLAAYQAVNAVATQICGATDVNDFKQVTRYRMTAAGIFQKVGPDGELKHAGLEEEKRASLA